MGALPATGRLNAERASTGSANLDQTLQVFRAILRGGEVVDASAAEASVWAYLRQARGLHAQVEAIEVLRRATVALPAPPASTRSLLGILDGHRRRLSGRPT